MITAVLFSARSVKDLPLDKFVQVAQGRPVCDVEFLLVLVGSDVTVFLGDLYCPDLAVVETKSRKGRVCINVYSKGHTKAALIFFQARLR